MIQLHDDSLEFSFPEVHPDATCSIRFIRTLRIPDDNREYPLPPGFSRFPMKHVDDCAERVPAAWRRHGGVLLPMYQAEAMWISFGGDYPVAVKIAAGKVSALTGESWTNSLSGTPRQDYAVIPEQPWLDGFYAAEGLIRQFVAMPLGKGYTAEEQITGASEHGGLQVVAYPMKADAYRRLRRDAPFGVEYSLACANRVQSAEMGLAPGGLMRQDIYEDPHGIRSWDQTAGSRCFVHILNSLQYVAATGAKPPTMPPSAREYTEAGLPWFEYYDADQEALSQPSKLTGLISVGGKAAVTGRGDLPDNDPVKPTKVVRVSKGGPIVSEGQF